MSQSSKNCAKFMVKFVDDSNVSDYNLANRFAENACYVMNAVPDVELFAWLEIFLSALRMPNARIDFTGGA